MAMIKLTAIAALAAATIGCANADGHRLNLDNAADFLSANRKIMCSTEEAKPVTYWWHGTAFSRRMGERDKVLFDVEGMNIRRCTTVNDDKRGTGFKLVSRELLLYKDAKTGEVLNTWDNPWTGETVDVLHVANDPVNFTSYTIGRDGKPGKWDGTVKDGRWWTTTAVPLFYPNPLAGDYQKEIGGTYHATEMFNFMGDVESLLSPETTTAEVQVGWVRVSEWLPWMMMGGREGIIYMHTAGRKLDDWSDLPDAMKQEIATYYPDYADAPPADDPRKNETSWSYYKKLRDGERVAPVRK